MNADEASLNVFIGDMYSAFFTKRLKKGGIDSGFQPPPLRGFASLSRCRCAAVELRPHPTLYNENPLRGLLAEEVGFEPTEPFGSPVFKTGAIDHSATPPK